MAFPGYLDNDEINDLTQAAQAGGLLEVPREVRLAGIPGAFVASLSTSSSPLSQFTLDLVAVNGVERMAGGVVPIERLLTNSAFQLKLRGREEAQVFDRLLNRIGNVSSGVADLPDPAQLPEVVQEERIIGFDDTLDLTFLRRGLTVAEAVARISVPRFENGVQVSAAKGGPWIMHGTTWLIAPSLAITNHHVINARPAGEVDAGDADLKLQAEHAVIEFDLDEKEATGTPSHVASLVATSKTLDYALLDLADAPERAIPVLATQPVALEATSRIAVNIVQHPRGEYKQVAFRNNLVTAADAATVRYYTDTDFGSSGSPVCDDRWQVVALHRGARYAAGAKYQGKDEAYVNFGSQIQAVLGDLRTKDAAAASRIETAQKTALSKSSPTGAFTVVDD
jgi:endonuclease G